MELFVQSINHPLYMISSEGRVFSRKRMAFVRVFPAKRGFLQASMDGKNVSVHKELVESFTKTAVGRIWFEDDDKMNCKLENLRWTLKDARPQTIIRPQLYILEDKKFIPYKEKV